MLLAHLPQPLETFLGGMETTLQNLPRIEWCALKPSLVEWKQATTEQVREIDGITLKPSLVEWKRVAGPRGAYEYWAPLKPSLVEWKLDSLQMGKATFVP